MSSNSENAKRYKIRLRNRIINILGARCCHCHGTRKLELAHRQPDNFNGAGRGSYKRYIYARNNIKNFMLLCNRCHKEYDSLTITINKENKDW